MKQFTWDISSQFPWNPFPPGQRKMLRIFNVWVRRYFLGCIIINNIGGWPNLKGILQYVRYPGNCWSITHQLYQLVPPTIFFAPFLAVRFLARGNRSNIAFPAPICDAGVMLPYHSTGHPTRETCHVNRLKNNSGRILRGKPRSEESLDFSPFHHPKWQQQMLNKNHRDRVWPRLYWRHPFFV